nr:glycosyltransferase family A protein [uncultured Methanolobus sp.]
MNSNYILITPCKNEAETLPALISSILNQTIKPVVWTIIDDDSDDNTEQIINDAMDMCPWIQYLKLNQSQKRDIGIHLAEVMQKAFEHSIIYCNTNSINYFYVGNVDADLTLDSSFFENLIIEFENDSLLGVASGGTDYTVGNKTIPSRAPEDEPSGGHMLIRKKCYEDCGGFPISHAADSVLKAKARMSGWKTKRFEENRALEARDVDSAEGYWIGFCKKGEAAYFINLPLIHVILKATKISSRYPYYGGLPYVLTYLKSMAKRSQRLSDPDLKKYYKNKWKQNIKKRL